MLKDIERAVDLVFKILSSAWLLKKLVENKKSDD